MIYYFKVQYTRQLKPGARGFKAEQLHSQAGVKIHPLSRPLAISDICFESGDYEVIIQARKEEIEVLDEGDFVTVRSSTTLEVA
jgi:hypothetical protein